MKQAKDIFFRIPNFDKNREPIQEEAFFSDLPEGHYPPGPWAAAGQFQKRFGIYIGDSEGIQTFIPEECLLENIVHLNRQPNPGPALAAMIEDLLPDLAKLKTGKEKIVRNIQGKNI